MILGLTIFHVLIYSLYWYFEGIREGFYYDRIPIENIYCNNRIIFRKHKNIKRDFVLQRLSFLIMTFGFGFFLTYDFLYVVGLLFLQPFIHLGMYYKTRNKLNPLIYEKGFMANASNTSTSFLDNKSKSLLNRFTNFKMYTKLTETPIIRIVFFILGLFLIFIALI